MRNLWKILATTVLLFNFSFTAHALDGWMGTGGKPTPTPEPPSFITPAEEPEATRFAASDEGVGVIDVTLEVCFSILRNSLAML